MVLENLPNSIHRRTIRWAASESGVEKSVNVAERRDCAIVCSPFPSHPPSLFEKSTAFKMINSVTRSALRLRVAPRLQRTASVWANVKAG